jgi:DNA polymerase-3 subunit epsilon
MREIVLDTETTGLDPSSGHRVVEIGAVEISNLIPTGRHFHCYVNPERDMPEEAYRVHGLSYEFLAQHRAFKEIAADFLDFIEDVPLVIHNAEFDTRFLNAEFALMNLPPLSGARIIDTLAMARRRHPGGPNSLDALCQRYAIDLSRRDKHGALVDANLLAEVYAELCGGRQAALSLPTIHAVRVGASDDLLRRRPQLLAPRLSAEEKSAHLAFVATIKSPIWDRYLASDEDPPAPACG